MIIVSTKLKADDKIIKKAKLIAQKLNYLYVDRGKQSIDTICDKYKAIAVLLISNNLPILVNKNSAKHTFHLGMAQLRIKNLIKGQPDHLINAIGKDCSSFLDCTLGLGIDSIVVSYYYGINITGIESSQVLAYITKTGYNEFNHSNRDITNAIKRIKVINNDNINILEKLPDKSIDVVYFDPMFKHTVTETTQFDAFRGINNQAGISKKQFNEACRVAKKKVIIKERTFSKIFEEFKIFNKVGGKYSRVVYGVKNVE